MENAATVDTTENLMAIKNNLMRDLVTINANRTQAANVVGFATYLDSLDIIEFSEILMNRGDLLGYQIEQLDWFIGSLTRLCRRHDVNGTSVYNAFESASYDPFEYEDDPCVIETGKLAAALSQ